MAATQHHGRKSPTPASAPNLEISPAKVWFFIQKAREFDVKDVVTDEGSGSNATDDGNLSVLEDRGDDPTYTELRMFINALTEDEQVDLVALTWLGRGDSDEVVKDYLRQTSGGDIRPELLERYLHAGREMVHYLLSIGIQLEPHEGTPDYFSELPGGVGGRSLMVVPFDGAAALGDELFKMRPASPIFSLLDRYAITANEGGTIALRLPGWRRTFLRLLASYWLNIPWRRKTRRDRRLTLGGALVGSLRKAMLDRAIPLRLNTELMELSVTDGTVTGAVFRHLGQELRLTARCGVVLATGGFEHNQSMREQMGERGRNYVVSRYIPERVRESLVETIESCPQPHASVAPVSRLLDAPGQIAPVAYSTNGKNVSDEATLEDISKSPPLPLPAGWSEDDLRRLISSVQVEDASIEELKPYVEADFKRFVYTLSLVPKQSGQRILELGANPYFTTTLLREFRSADLHLANFFDKPGREGKQKVTIHSTGEVIEYSFKQFNIEEEIFPYDDNSFDVVLFCEIIEHLLTDPVHALTEIRRVLKPGGDLVLTTPNVARLDNARKIIAGENVYDPYSGHGPYGRHNREYTQEDLFSLLNGNGFTVRTIFTADVHPETAGSSVSLRTLAPLLRNRQADLGQYIFCRCSVSTESKRLTPIRPERLYRSRREKEAVPGLE